MAENVKGGAEKLPSAQVLKTLVSQASGIEADLSKSRGELGQVVKNAEDKHNIHRKAFKLARQLTKMDETKLAEFLRHFDHYRDALKINDLAGIDMFAGSAGKTKPEGEQDLRPPHLQRVDADRQAEKAAQEQSESNVTALKAGVRQKPKATDADYERGQRAFADGFPGMIPEDLQGEKKRGERFLEGWSAASLAAAEAKDGEAAAKVTARRPAAAKAEAATAH